MNQEEIFHAIQNSTRQESKAIQQLFKFYPHAKSIVIRHTGLCVEDAENIYQDCIICIVYRVKEGSFIVQSEECFKRFILKFVKNKSLSLARQKSKLVNNVPDYLVAEEEEGLQIREEALITKVFEVASKSRNGKEIITRRFLENQSYPEIEDSMNYSKNSAKNGLYRVFESVRKEVKFDDYIIK
jgi:DNA-directed RNA polymerase specialized sigma24 family protein